MLIIAKVLERVIFCKLYEVKKIAYEVQSCLSPKVYKSSQKGTQFQTTFISRNFEKMVIFQFS